MNHIFTTNWHAIHCISEFNFCSLFWGQKMVSAQFTKQLWKSNFFLLWNLAHDFHKLHVPDWKNNPTLICNYSKMLGSDMLNHKVRGYTEYNKIQYYSKAPTPVLVLQSLCKPWTTEQCGFGICWIWPRLQPVFTYASLQCQHLTLHQFYKCSQEFPINLNSFYHWN